MCRVRLHCGDARLVGGPPTGSITSDSPTKRTSVNGVDGNFFSIPEASRQIMVVELTLAKGAIIALAGCGAGFINAIVGSGTLISFPTLLGAGFEKVAANMANNIGLAPGSFSAVVGYRRELVGQRRRLLTLGPASALGGLTGALLLLTLPSTAFKTVVPFLVLLGVALVIAQPIVTQRLKARQAELLRLSGGSAIVEEAFKTERIRPALIVVVFLTGIYGGYFGAGQGVILTGLLGMALGDDMQRTNAAKNVLAGLVNGVAAIVFIALRPISWEPAILIAVGSVIGAQLGAKVGRKIQPNVLRALIVVIGLVVAIKLLIG
jgi:uncharacterized protein